MKTKLTFALFVLSLNTAFAGTWCAYSEFLKNPNPTVGYEQEVIRMRALQCTGEPGGVKVTNSDGTPCDVSNATIGNNLVKIANEICSQDPKTCLGAYQALRTWDPVNVKNNPAYNAIFGCL